MQKNWAKELSLGVISPKELRNKGHLEDVPEEDIKIIKENFDIRVPQSWVSRLSEPAIAKQVLPSVDELNISLENLEDPLGDEVWGVVPGITHRYPDRVLLKPTYLCGVYCRFCFRRYKVSKSSQNLKADALIGALDYIRNHKEIWEVIFTGGDPLTLTTTKLKGMFLAINDMDHVKCLRIHTRMPMVIPERVDDDLLNLLSCLKKTVWIAIHANSHLEFTPQVKEGIQKLRKAGVNLLLQSVLLKGVNDSFEQLRDLFYLATELGIKPYYLHYPDLAKGTDHFRISLSDAIKIFGALRGQISGVCLPQFMIDIPGGYGKIPVDLERIKQNDDGSYTMISPISGKEIRVSYPNQKE